MEPTAIPAEMPTLSPTLRPSKSLTIEVTLLHSLTLSCLETGKICQEASECCLGLCDFGICTAAEVMMFTNPISGSASVTSFQVSLAVCSI